MSKGRRKVFSMRECCVCRHDFQRPNGDATTKYCSDECKQKAKSYRDSSLKVTETFKDDYMKFQGVLNRVDWEKVRCYVIELNNERDKRIKPKQTPAITKIDNRYWEQIWEINEFDADVEPDNHEDGEGDVPMKIYVREYWHGC